MHAATIVFGGLPLGPLVSKFIVFIPAIKIFSCFIHHVENKVQTFNYCPVEQCPVDIHF